MTLPDTEDFRNAKPNSTQNGTHGSLELLFRAVLLQGFLAGANGRAGCGDGGGGGCRQVFRAEAEALQKLKHAAVLFLELGHQVALGADLARKLETNTQRTLLRSPFAESADTDRTQIRLTA